MAFLPGIRMKNGSDPEKRKNRGGEDSYTSRLLRNPLWVDAIIYVALLLVVAVTILPIWAVVIKSISTKAVTEAYPLLLWPKEISVESYKYIVRTPKLIDSFGVTGFITVVGTALNLIFTVPAGYALTKTSVPGIRIAMMLIVVTMMFSAGIIPLFLVVNALHLLDTVWAMIFPTMVGAFNVILVRNFVWNIPKELEESAFLDGANEAVIVTRIILPLSKSIIATVGLFYAVGHWNEFYHALFFVNNPAKWPLQLVLRSIIFDSNMSGMSDIEKMLYIQRTISPENIQAGCIVFATVPILLVYPFLQKYFTKGIMMGAVKG